MQFQPGQKLTIISIGGIAHTTKNEVTVATVLPVPLGNRFGTYKQRGKRKEFYLTIKHDDLVFDGWDLQILTDSEIPGYGGFKGNACLNLGMAGLTDLDYLRSWIELRNLNGPMDDETKAKIVVPGKTIQDEGTLLYPEIETGHAVINQMKEKLEISA